MESGETGNTSKTDSRAKGKKKSSYNSRSATLVIEFRLVKYFALISVPTIKGGRTELN